MKALFPLLRLGLLSALLLPVGSGGSPAWAGPQDAGEAEVPPAHPHLELTATLQEVYLAGFPIRVPVVAHNTGTTVQSLPDLSARPHLVTFALTFPGGREQRRHTTAPDPEPDARWQFQPRNRRRVWLEIPSGAALDPGRYQVQVRVRDPDSGTDRTWLAAEGSFVVEPPHPVFADLSPDHTRIAEGGWALPWLHRSQNPPGLQLYLYETPLPQRTTRGTHIPLLALPDKVEPRITASRTREAADRHLYWVDDGALVYTRIRGQGLRHAPRRVGLPYPRWEPLARGSTDPAGGFHLPVWIPAPSGRGGEVRIVSVDDTGRARFRKAVRLPVRPEAAATVDAAASLRLALVHGGKLDLYTVRTGAGQARPAAGVRLFAPARNPEAEPPAHPLPPADGATFGLLPATEDHPGGLAVFAWSHTGRDPALVTGSWFSLDGTHLGPVPGVPLPPGAEIRSVIPGGTSSLAVLWREADGRGWVRATDWDGPAAAGDLSPHDALRAGTGARWWLLRTHDGRGIVVSRIEEPEGERPPAKGTGGR